MVLTACIAVTAGCGGGATTDRVAGLNPDEILRQSATATDALDAFRVAVDATVQADVAPGTLPKLLGDALRAPVTLTGEGPVDGGAASFDFDAKVTGLPTLQGNVTKVDGQLFVGVLLTEYKVDFPAAQVSAVQPGRLAHGLLSWATGPAEVGREAVDGVPTVHLAATVDAAQALSDIAPALEAIQGTRLSAAARRQLEDAFTTNALDLWIGIDDLLPRRITAQLGYTGGVDALRALRKGSLELDVRFTRLGERTTITPPETTNVLDLARLRDLASR